MKNLFLTCIFVALLSGLAMAESRLRNVAEGTVYRDEAGVEVVNVFSFRQRPKPGEVVTVIPLTDKVLPQPVKITKVAQGAQCTNEDKPWFQIDLALVKSGPFVMAKPKPGRNASYPFDVAVLHPQNTMARYLAFSAFKQKDLPSSVSLNTVKGAVDLNKNGKPDIVFAGFCCDNRRKSHAEGCEYMCSETWILRDGKWVKHDQSQPC